MSACVLRCAACRNKWEVLNIPYPLDGVASPSKDNVHRVIAHFNEAGIPVICAE